MAVNSLGASGYMVIKKAGEEEVLMVRIENFEVSELEFEQILAGNGNAGITITFHFERDNNNILSAVLNSVNPPLA